MIGDAFKKLFDVLWSVITWIGTLLKNLFQGLADIIIGFFKIIYALIDGFLYFLYKVGVLAVKLFFMLLEAAKMLWSLVVGFAKTLASLSYTPRGSSGAGGYSEVFGRLFKMLDSLQLDVIAYILLFIIWITTAVGAIKLVSSIRVGGD